MKACLRAQQLQRTTWDLCFGVGSVYNTHSHAKMAFTLPIAILRRGLSAWPSFHAFPPLPSIFHMIMNQKPLKASASHSTLDELGTGDQEGPQRPPWHSRPILVKVEHGCPLQDLHFSLASLPSPSHLTVFLQLGGSSFLWSRRSMCPQVFSNTTLPLPHPEIWCKCILFPDFFWRHLSTSGH